MVDQKIIMMANEAVGAALVAHNAALRAYESAALARDKAGMQLVKAREDLEDVLRVHAGLETEIHRVYNADRTALVPRFMVTLNV